MGLVAVFGWRYASPRRLVLSDPTGEFAGQDRGFFTFDYLLAVAGPRWFPELLVFPIVGLLVGAVIGLAAVPMSASGPGWRKTTISMVGALVTGAVIGLFAALYARQVYPSQLVQKVDDPSFVLTDAWIEANPFLIRGGPRYFEMSPELVYFPLTGALCALTVVLIAEVIRRVILRERRAPRSPHEGL